MNTDENLISKKQLSEKIGVSTKTIEKWRKLGMPVILIDGSGKRPIQRFIYSEVLGWMSQQNKNTP